MPEAHLEAAEQLLHEHAMQRIEGALSGIDYHQFYVMTEDEDSDPEYPTVRSNHDLIAPTSGYGFCAFTGIAMGTVHLTIEILDLPPEAIDDTREWEAITELSFLANATAARIQLLMDDTPPPFKTFYPSASAQALSHPGACTGSQPRFRRRRHGKTCASITCSRSGPRTSSKHRSSTASTTSGNTSITSSPDLIVAAPRGERNQGHRSPLRLGR